MNLYATVMEFCKRFKKEGTEKQLEDILQNEDLLKNAVMTVETIPDIEDYVVTLLQKAIDLRNTISGRRYSDIILTAQKLIREEYMSEEISLNVVAARVCMSPSYFSTIFSKETGKTFIEYLTEVRMERQRNIWYVQIGKRRILHLKLVIRIHTILAFCSKKHRDVLLKNTEQAGRNGDSYVFL